MKKILIFNDISGLGNCSLVANLPIFSKLGHYCMPVVTGCYSCQTGFDNFAVTPNPNTVDFAKRISANAKPDAFYVGFCNDKATLNGVKTVVEDVLDGDVCLFVDPIMGDNGRLYPVFDDDYVIAMKSLVSRAHCITPNVTEACMLLNVDYAELTSHRNDDGYLELCGSVFKDFLTEVKCRTAVITGIAHGEQISNLVLDGASVDVVTTSRVDVDYSGTGDLFSSVVLGELLNGKTLLQATKAGADFVSDSARATSRSDRRFGVDFCKALGNL